MANLSDLNTVTIRYEARICKVNDRVGYFHCWEQYADVIAPGLTIGSHPGGQYSRVFGIVEFKDGVERVDTSKIKFIDEEHKSLCSLVDKFNNIGNPNPISVEELKQMLETSSTSMLFRKENLNG